MALKYILTIMEWAWRLIWVNFLWLLFSLPVITFIPSTIALFAVGNKWLTEDKDIDIFPTFFNAFKSYFLKSYAVGLPILLIGLFLYVDFVILQKQAGALFSVILYAILIVSLMYIVLFFYFIPVFIQVDVPFSKQLLISFLVAFRQPLISLMMLCGILIVVVVFVCWTGIGILFIGSLSVLFSTKATLNGLKKYNFEI